jgi:hypothetical protein
LFFAVELSVVRLSTTQKSAMTIEVTGSRSTRSTARVIRACFVIALVVLALVSCAGKRPSSQIRIQNNLNEKHGAGAVQVGSCHNADYVSRSRVLESWCWVRTDLVLIDRHHPQRRTGRKQRVAVCFMIESDERNTVTPMSRAHPGSSRPCGWMPPHGWDVQ